PPPLICCPLSSVFLMGPAAPTATRFPYTTLFRSFAHDYAGEFTRYRFKAIYFQPGHGDLVHQLLGTNARINPLTQPLFTEFHRSCLVLMPFMRLIRNPACAVLPFGLTKLTQKTQVVFEEHAQVFHAIAKHGQALNAQTKSKAT